MWRSREAVTNVDTSVDTGLLALILT